MTRVEELRLARATIARAELLGPRPLRALAALGAASLRHGRSLFALAAAVAARDPQRVALVDGDGPVTFEHLVARSVRRSEALEPLLPRGRRARIALLGRNRAAYVEWVLACGRLGADLVLLNTTLPEEQLDSVRRRRPPDLVVCDPEFVTLVESTGLTVLRTDEDRPRAAVVHRGGTRARRSPWRSPWRSRRDGTIGLLTSGTTGASTLVTQRPTPVALARTALDLVERLDVRAGHPTLLTVPLLHGHGLATLALCLASGSPLHLPPTSRGPELLGWIDREEIPVVVVVPTILHRLVEAADAGHGTGAGIRTIVCGSAPLDEALTRRALEAFGPVLFDLYGTSETGLVALATPADLAAEPASVGRLLTGVTVRIVGDDGLEVAPGRSGRIIVSSPQAPDGLDTGDLGHVDPTGRLFLHGRADDLIVRGGENVFAATIEERVRRESTDIGECAVVAEPDESELGSGLHLFVVPAPGRAPTPESVLADLARLPRAIRPTRVTLVDHLPRNLSGEVTRRRLGAATATRPRSTPDGPPTDTHRAAAATPDHVTINRANWESRVPHHERGYDLDRFRADPGHLSDVVRFDLPRLGPIEGLDVVHLQCHLGTDTLSLARLGARRVTGLDFSPGALAVARRLAADCGADIHYVEREVHDAVDALGAARFDLVYTGVGALCWLPDVRRWAEVVAALLRPGGRLFIREGHPVLWALAEPRPDGLVVLEFPYFETAGIAFREPWTYVEHSEPLAAPDIVHFNHGLAEIITAVTDAGLTLTSIEEHDSVPWNPLGPAMVEVEGGEFRLREMPERLPASYTLQATKPSR